MGNKTDLGRVGMLFRKLYEQFSAAELRVLLTHQQGLAAIYQDEAARIRARSAVRASES